MPGRTNRGARASTIGLMLASLTFGILLSVPAPAAQAAATGQAVHPRVYAGGGVIPFGDAQSVNRPPSAPLGSVIVAMAVDPASTASRQGYW